MPAVALRGTTILPGMIVHFDIMNSQNSFQDRLDSDARISDNELLKKFLVRPESCNIFNTLDGHTCGLGLLEKYTRGLKRLNNITGHLDQ